LWKQPRCGWAGFLARTDGCGTRRIAYKQGYERYASIFFVDKSKGEIMNKLIFGLVSIVSVKNCFLKSFVGLLLLSAVFIGCDALNNGETVDKAALQTAIDSANSANNGVEISIDGTDIYKTIYWVTAAQKSTFINIINTAQAVYDTTTSDQTTVDTTKTTLESATATFIGQKQLGSDNIAVRIAGQYYDGTNVRACYWENGIRINLENSVNAGANGIAKNGDDIYIVGYNSDGACYWKNGTRYMLLPSDQSSAQGIAISGSNIYIVGHYYTGSGWQACYWLNGAKSDLSHTVSSYAWDIAISGSDIYIVGDDDNNACYWKNGTQFLFSEKPSSAYGIAVSGANIYAAGSYVDNTVTKACYWLDGTKTDLTGGWSAMAITISGSDVYISGSSGSYEASSGCYWKNGAMTTLNGNTGDIFVFGTDVYITGSYGESHQLCYWKNGVRKDLPGGVMFPGSILVTSE
jgi:hypothetical protein